MVDEAEDTWRIDELAHRASIPVDTIRFYAREGLLPPPRRSGRLTLYGPRHQIRLDQIRDLQARQFNLGAIRTLLEENRLGIVETLFAAGEGAFDRPSLVAAAGVDEELVAELESVGLLRDPSKDDRTAYDGSDVQVLKAIKGLIDTGMPRRIVVELAKVYVEHFADMEQEVFQVFNGEAWDEDERREFRERVPARVGTILPLSERLLDYVHHRTVQRMTLATMRVEDAAR